jgi:hypothetical protein
MFLSVDAFLLLTSAKHARSDLVEARIRLFAPVVGNVRDVDLLESVGQVAALGGGTPASDNKGLKICSTMMYKEVTTTC